MKFLLFIMVFVWAEYVNASSDYFINGTRVRAGGRFRVVRQKDAADNSIVAIRTNKTSILAQRLKGSFLPKVVSQPSISSWYYNCGVYRYSRYIHPGLESYTFSAPKESRSIIRKIIITRKNIGPIGLHGNLNFNEDFGETFKSEDSKVAERLELEGHHSDFLISGADSVEVVLSLPKGSKRKRK